MQSPIITLENISKSYGKTRALDCINLEIDANQIFGIIGPDGAGKSTLFRIIATLLLPDSGDCRALGFDCVREYAHLRKVIGYMPGNFSLYADLSVEENLEFFACVFHTSIEENYYLIKDIYHMLEPFKSRKAGALSGGMKQKLALCCALIHNPKILLLDEPTTGVDAVSRQEFWEILRALKSQMTIIVSTPYMDEASLCDKIALINSGKILHIGTPSEICTHYALDLYEFYNIPIKALDTLRAQSAVKSCFLFGTCYHIAFEKGFEIAYFVESLQNLKSADFANLQYKKIPASIEDSFMEFVR
ncbi:ATPase [Helicobacter sp. MIT 00-7814]|uniref:ABC transporter ATP-binding protein n=1 Tax=unclassified Helicobacter TaxID=2593540 RepID=UPI000E1EB4B0|nr:MULTISPECIES: ABC transporter ATP-binding protein [unclassified Helicobacter]RDU55868.1 ATPase [Helicobacter sp. MIT 00-7814]RDU56826.1 ATPase [Helicobacter sp. MIT 99-10781]